MKSLLRLGFVSAWALMLGSTAFSQIDHIFVGKTEENVQTGAATVIVNPQAPSSTYGGAYGFGVNVGGTGLSAPTVTLPSGATNPTVNTSAHNSGVLGFNADDDAWGYGSPNFNNWGSQTATDIDTLFGIGTYTVSVPTYGSVNLNLNTGVAQVHSVVTNAPIFTLTGGAWVNGTYQVGVGQTVTITTNAFGEFNANADAYMELRIDDNTGSSLYQSARFYSDNNAADNFFTYTINPNTLVSGQTYSLYSTFAAILDSTTLSGAMAASFLERNTTLTLQAVPEPSTAAALAGVATLAVITLRRRRVRA